MASTLKQKCKVSIKKIYFLQSYQGILGQTSVLCNQLNSYLQIVLLGNTVLVYILLWIWIVVS